MSLIQTTIYKTNSGKEPFTIWLLDLDKTVRAVIITRLKRINLGNFGNCKLLKNACGIWELIIDIGPGYRIYFAKQSNTVIILLVGGDKKTQERDIIKAQEYWFDYQGLINEKNKKKF